MRLGFQNYTVRDHLEKDFLGTMKTLRAGGLKYCELAGNYGMEATEVHDLLQEADVQAVGAHVGFDRLEGGMDALAEEANMLGYTAIVLPWVDKEEYASGWKSLAKRLETIGKRAHEAGLRFLYHNHAFEFEKEDGRAGLEILYSESDSAVVGAELDTYWVRYGGDEPVDWIDKLGGRVPYVHLKDMSKEEPRHDVPCGDGSLDWQSIHTACEKAGVEYGIIELDNSADPIDAILRGARFFRAAGLFGSR